MCYFEIESVMKRRFRQKQDLAPKDDPESKKDTSEDRAEDNVKIDDVIGEIDTYLEPHPETPEKQ